jgi:hypothetical protein
MAVGLEFGRTDPGDPYWKSFAYRLHLWKVAART